MSGSVWQGTTYYAHFSAKRSLSTPSTPAKPDETKPTLAPIPEMLNGEDHYAYLLGYEDGTVRPNGSISRAEVATVLFRLLKDDVRTQNLTKDNAYSDVSDTAWYAAAASTLSKMGVISGYPDGTFGPQRNISRAETATMINRMLERVPSAESRLLSRDVMQIWPDANPGDWFYLAMQEATNSHDYERNAKWAAADEQWTALRETRDWKALEQ